MIGILLAEGVALIALDASWLHYRWPTWLGWSAILLALGVWLALTLIERRIERTKRSSA